MAMNDSEAERGASLSEIVRLLGDHSPAPRHGAILATGATAVEIRRALLWLQGEEEVLGEDPPPLEGRSALVYDILEADEPEETD